MSKTIKEILSGDLPYSKGGSTFNLKVVEASEVKSSDKGDKHYEWINLKLTDGTGIIKFTWFDPDKLPKKDMGVILEHVWVKEGKDDYAGTYSLNLIKDKGTISFTNLSNIPDFEEGKENYPPTPKPIEPTGFSQGLAPHEAFEKEFPKIYNAVDKMFNDIYNNLNPSEQAEFEKKYDGYMTVIWGKGN